MVRISVSAALSEYLLWPVIFGSDLGFTGWKTAGLIDRTLLRIRYLRRSLRELSSNREECATAGQVDDLSRTVVPSKRFLVHIYQSFHHKLAGGKAYASWLWAVPSKFILSKLHTSLSTAELPPLKLLFYLQPSNIYRCGSIESQPHINQPFIHVTRRSYC